MIINRCHRKRCKTILGKSTLVESLFGRVTMKARNLCLSQQLGCTGQQKEQWKTFLKREGEMKWKSLVFALKYQKKGGGGVDRQSKIGKILVIVEAGWWAHGVTLFSLPFYTFPLLLCSWEMFYNLKVFEELQEHSHLLPLDFLHCHWFEKKLLALSRCFPPPPTFD